MTIRWHNVSVAIDYADMRQNSCWLRGHGDDYGDIEDEFLRPITDFEGTIKPKKYLCVFTYPIVIFWNYENGGGGEGVT